ncbi:hypothetical protein LP083-2_003 [Listeria phage LP-083-2]|uniref:Uncharacterized protein n=3 Tax=Pecentumvirus TaxID=1857844 RepID=A0A059T874_9CAUD|nr:hypothetical protein LP083-2_003 [Listeria phage LP-083-2]YP_009784626.1 hypothetical protein QLX40_gp114 [Listeria phage LP-124]AHL19211.1 hypothetical protein LP083-2_003 [Listeria phage LP-083-2]AHL19511.1 hypothetical protein LP124_114 [Listeria phage LP-124]QDK05027.2 hypothetical protein FK486_0180 [Listeria phage LP-066]
MADVFGYNDFLTEMGIKSVRGNATIEQLRQDSSYIVEDIKRAFNFKLYKNELTGENNMVNVTNKPLSLVVFLADNKSKVLFYDSVNFTSKKARDWKPFHAIFKNGKTYIVQDNSNFALTFVIKNGTIIKERKAPKNSGLIFLERLAEGDL